jgi:hypothetical protein
VWRYIKNKLYGAALVLLAVAIISPAVASAAVKIQTSICGDFVAPTVISPLSGYSTQSSSVIVNGEADASLPVTIIKNGAPIAVTDVSSSGDYSISVPLSAGDNVFIAKETNGCGTVKESNPVTVQMIVPQQPEDGTVIEPTVSPQGVAPVIVPSTPTAVLNQPAPTQQQNTQGFRVPIISQPVSGTTYTVNRIWVTGTAEPLSIVTIYTNGNSVARVQASLTGEFGAVVELKTGVTTIEVGSEKDGKTALSKPVTVTCIPQKPVESGPSPVVVAVTAAAVTVTAAAATSGGVWAVKFINARRLR